MRLIHTSMTLDQEAFHGRIALIDSFQVKTAPLAFDVAAVEQLVVQFQLRDSSSTFDVQAPWTNIQIRVGLATL